MIKLSHAPVLSQYYTLRTRNGRTSNKVEAADFTSAEVADTGGDEPRRFIQFDIYNATDFACLYLIRVRRQALGDGLLTEDFDAVDVLVLSYLDVFGLFIEKEEPVLALVKEEVLTRLVVNLHLRVRYMVS